MKAGAKSSKVRPRVSVSDRTLTRLIRAGILALAVLIPLVAAVYVLDRGSDHGPTLVERQIAAAEEAVRKAPGKIPPRLALAQIYEAANRPDSALEQYDEVLRANAPEKTALLGRGDILLAKGDFAGASKAFTRVIGTASRKEFSNIDPQLEHAYYGLGAVAIAQGRSRDAVAALETAVRVDPADADAWYLLGTARLATSDAKGAVEALERAVAFVPTGWCEPYAALSQASAKLGRKADAEFAGGMVDFCQQQTDAAVERLEALTSGPAAVKAMMGLGMIAEATNDRVGALRWYTKVIATDPANFNARTGLTRLGIAPPSEMPHPSAPSTGSSTAQGQS